MPLFNLLKSNRDELKQLYPNKKNSALANNKSNPKNNRPISKVAKSDKLNQTDSFRQYQIESSHCGDYDWRRERNRDREWERRVSSKYPEFLNHAASRDISEHCKHYSNEWNDFEGRWLGRSTPRSPTRCHYDFDFYEGRHNRKFVPDYYNYYDHPCYYGRKPRKCDSTPYRDNYFKNEICEGRSHQDHNCNVRNESKKRILKEREPYRKRYDKDEAIYHEGRAKRSRWDIYNENDDYNRQLTKRNTSRNMAESSKYSKTERDVDYRKGVKWDKNEYHTSRPDNVEIKDDKHREKYISNSPPRKKYSYNHPEPRYKYKELERLRFPEPRYKYGDREPRYKCKAVDNMKHDEPRCKQAQRNSKVRFSNETPKGSKSSYTEWLRQLLKL